MRSALATDPPTVPNPRIAIFVITLARRHSGKAGISVFVFALA
jgi:hypothetical protein